MMWLAQRPAPIVPGSHIVCAVHSIRAVAAAEVLARRGQLGGQPVARHPPMGFVDKESRISASPHTARHGAAVPE
jgi:hypothetical protein